MTRSTEKKDSLGHLLVGQFSPILVNRHNVGTDLGRRGLLFRSLSVLRTGGWSLILEHVFEAHLDSAERRVAPKD